MLPPGRRDKPTDEVPHLMPDAGRGGGQIGDGQWHHVAVHRLTVRVEQQLQQFVTSSIWAYVDVRQRIACWADEFIASEAYVADDTGF